jgi:hypothetical protein
VDEIADIQGNDIVRVFDVLPAVLEYLFGDALFQIHITPSIWPGWFVGWYDGHCVGIHESNKQAFCNVDDTLDVQVDDMHRIGQAINFALQKIVMERTGFFQELPQKFDCRLHLHRCNLKNNRSPSKFFVSGHGYLLMGIFMGIWGQKWPVLALEEQIMQIQCAGISVRYDLGRDMKWIKSQLLCQLS